MILESVENGPLIWPTIEENRVTRPKKYSELSATEATQADCDVKAKNIILQGLPLEVYALQGDDPIDAINHMISFLSTVVASRFPTTNNQLRNSSNPRQQATINDGRVTLQPVQRRQISFATADNLDAYDFDCDELNTAKVDLMANPSQYGLDVPVENAEIYRLKQTLSEQLQEKESLMKTVTVLKNDFKKEETRNIDREFALEKKIKRLDNIVYKRDQSAQTVHMLTKPKFFYDHSTKQALEILMLAEESRSKIILKQQDPMVLEKKEKGLIIAALRDELRKLKRKVVVDNVVTSHTIAPNMFKVDVEPLAPKLLENRTTHSDYIRHTQEQAAILREVIEQGKSQNPLNNSLDMILIPKLQTTEDLQGDALLHYDAEIELMNLILLSIQNNIYNFMDACTSAKDMWKRVERLMKGTIQNKVDRETRFTNEFDQFVAEPKEALVFVYNRFAQLMNDLERNDMHFPIVTINTKFMNSLQQEWLKYVTQVRLAKPLTVDTFDDIFNYLQQFEKLVNTSRANKLEKSHDPLALIAHTGSSSRNTSSYYVTHPTYVVDYDDEYHQDDIQTNSKDPLTSTINQAVIQGDRVNIQSKNSGLFGIHPGNTSTVQCYNCSGKGYYARNYPQPRVRDLKYFMEQMLMAKQDEAGVILIDEQNDFLYADASKDGRN
uniref:Gag-Pol polyprotein n=1 Tax=Tanacetum cinerariifolium TaxID=118510 RepID=A0A6L2J276_TANCI|nr:hypothetical protein [Tanacetum cinerariifolium]